MDTTTNCLNGELKAGDLVLSSPDGGYACLVGRVLSIEKAGTPEHDTENPGDDIHVDFTAFDYSDSREDEIEERMTGLYGEQQYFGDLSIDDVIMAPDMLVRITGIGQHLLDIVLDSEQAADAVFHLVKDGPGFDRDSRPEPGQQLMDYAEFEQHINTHFYKIKPEALENYRNYAEKREQEGGPLAGETYRDFYLEFGLAALETEIYHVGRLINLGTDFTVATDEVRAAARHLTERISDENLKYLSLSGGLEGTRKDFNEYEAALAAYENGGITTEKLYSPINFHLVDNDYLEDYDGDYWRDELPDREALEFTDKIEAFIDADREHYSTDRGLMEYCDNSAVSGKVHSLIPGIEEVDGSLWMVAHIKQTEPLSPLEVASLKDYWAGQLSDGAGESWEQHEIKTYRGDLYMEPWTNGKSFFIDTSEEFNRRMGREAPVIETPVEVSPAVAALSEPDATDDAEVAALREKLVDRLNGNLDDYVFFLKNLEAKELVGVSSELAAMAGAHYYLTELHNFHTSELNYLLKFENPLEVVGDAFRQEDISHSKTMWEIFDKQEALRGNYALASNLESTPDIRQMLNDKFYRNLEDGLTDLRREMVGGGFSAEKMIELANDISSLSAAYDYLRNEYPFTDEQITALLEYGNPLAMIAESWDAWQLASVGDIDVDKVVGRILVNEFSIEADVGTPKEPAHFDSAEKPSIMAQLRDAAKEPKPHSVKEKQDKSGPER